jgi:hypothetical protein
VILFTVSAFAEEDSEQDATPTVTAYFYLHTAEDIDSSVWGSQPQSSSYYFPTPLSYVTREIVKPDSAPTNSGTYSGGGTWRVWNGTSYVSAACASLPTLSDFTIPADIIITGSNITWYVIKDQTESAGDTWHIDGYIEGYQAPEVPPVVETPETPTPTSPPPSSVRENPSTGVNEEVYNPQK